MAREDQEREGDQITGQRGHRIHIETAWLVAVVAMLVVGAVALALVFTLGSGGGVSTPTPLATIAFTPVPPTATPTLVPTPTPTPTPAPVVGYRLYINGVQVRPGQTIVPVANGIVSLDKAPDYPPGTEVILNANPNLAGSQIDWSGVDSQPLPALSTVRMITDRFVTVTVRAPTPTSPPTPTPIPGRPSATATALAFGVAETQLRVTVANPSGGVRLAFTVTSSTDDGQLWLSVGHSGFELNPGTRETINVSVARRGMRPGSYMGLLAVSYFGTVTGTLQVLVSMEVPIPTPTPAPTPTRTPAPSYTLIINGTLVQPGQTQVALTAGTVDLSQGPGPDGGYPANAVVTLAANPYEPDTQVIWGAVDRSQGTLAEVRMVANRLVTVRMVRPTATPPSTPTRTLPPALPPAPLPTDDHGNSFATATVIGVPSTTRGAITPGGDVDYFRFQAQSGPSYVIEVRLGSLSDSILTLYAQDGTTLLAQNDDGDGLGAGSRITRGIPVSGTYYLRVVGYDRALTGTYTLVITTGP